MSVDRERVYVIKCNKFFIFPYSFLQTKKHYPGKIKRPMNPFMVSLNLYFIYKYLNSSFCVCFGDIEIKNSFLI